MNNARIKSAIAEIEKCERALAWLEEYGSQLTGEKGQFEFHPRAYFAGSCEGADQAMGMLASFARLSLPELVKTSIENCRNTIVMSKSAILEEVGE